MRYYVDIYDMFDGWGGGCWGFFEDRLFDDLDEAKKKCDELQAELAEGNKECGEHYGVIDSEKNREVYCTRGRGGSMIDPAVAFVKVEEREPKYCEKCGLELERNLQTVRAGFNLYTGKEKWRTHISYSCPKYGKPSVCLVIIPHTYITRTSEDNDERLAE